VHTNTHIKLVRTGSAKKEQKKNPPSKMRVTGRNRIAGTARKKTPEARTAASTAPVTLF
jgi:hypothetical protein